MKAKIATTTPIKQEWLDEVKEHIPDIEFEIVKTKEKLQTYYNPWAKSNYGVFQHLRQIVNTPKNQGYRYRVYNMTANERKALGMTDHQAAYDNLDRDGVLDFYMGVSESLQTKTTRNGFKYNWARVFIHECLHGKEQENGREYLSATRPDRTHEYDDAGRLKELIAEHFKIRQGFLSVVAGLIKIVEILKKRLIKIETPQPFLVGNYRISQPFGTTNKKLYPQTGIHIGTDFATPVETPIYAPLSGKLTNNYSNSTGVMATLETKSGWYQFLHLDEVQNDGFYKQGQLIGLTGKTGKVTGPHVCVRLWRTPPDIKKLTKDNIEEHLIDVTK